MFEKKEKHGYEKHSTKLGKIWHFLAHEDSWQSFAVDAVLVVVIGKFVILPLLGLMMGTSFPMVAVVSSSMDHKGDFNSWWQTHGEWYEEHNITKEQFTEFPYKNGFNKGDIFVVKGISVTDLKVGDVIIYRIPGKSDPIIHRIIEVGEAGVRTKGDANPAQLSFETEVMESQIEGKAIIRVPLLGWVKVIFVELAAKFK